MDVKGAMAAAWCLFRSAICRCFHAPPLAERIGGSTIRWRCQTCCRVVGESTYVPDSRLRASLDAQAAQARQRQISSSGQAALLKRLRTKWDDATQRRRKG